MSSLLVKSFRCLIYSGCKVCPSLGDNGCVAEVQGLEEGLVVQR